MMMLRWTLFETLLMSAVICKQKRLHENEITKLWSFFKTASAIMLSKAILESPYKVLQVS